MNSEVLIALLITSLAGLAAAIGGCIGILFKRENKKFISFVLGFAAGVMVGISLFELLPESIETAGFLKAGIAFFIGAALMFGIDFLIPHEYIGQQERINDKTNKRLLKTGTFVAIGIAIHNFPEGMAVFYSTLYDFRLGLTIAVAIAIHNIPEGIAVATPIYAATGSRAKGFLFAFLSGLAEPIGAIVTALFLLPFLTESLLGLIRAGISGLMVYISIDELLPVSQSYGYSHIPIISFFGGMGVMFLSMVLIR
jgi:zinc transporter, ZIP family